MEPNNGFRVVKKQPTTVFFETSHHEAQYQRLTLKRLTSNVKVVHPQQLNSESPKISNLKYRDLKSLCDGDNSVIRLREYQEFYKNLPHHNE